MIRFFVERRNIEGVAYYEATVRIPGMLSTKVARIDYNTSEVLTRPRTCFETKSAAIAACRARATMLGGTARITYLTPRKKSRVSNLVSILGANGDFSKPSIL